MSLTRFLESLFSEGRVRVGRVVDPEGQPLPISSQERDEALQLLTDFERQYRLELPGSPPQPEVAALMWGAESVYRASSLLAHRDVGAEPLRRVLATACPESPNPAVCYGVDLTLRFLPDLMRLARAASTDDPLIDVLMGWCRQWPLSSVGIADVGPVDVSGFVADTTLRRLYVDRILETSDESRLDHPLIQETVLTALGAHPRLSPRLADAARQQKSRPAQSS